MRQRTTSNKVYICFIEIAVHKESHLDDCLDLRAFITIV